MAGKIPCDVDELIALYDPFIYHTIRRVIPYISHEDLEDLHADVLHRILEVDYLTRCRAYAEGRTGYNFLSSLRALTERTAKNHLRYRGAKRRTARVVSLDDVVRDLEGTRGKLNVRDTVRSLSDTKTCRTMVTSIDLKDRVQKLRAHLHARNRVIGGLPAVKVLDQMLDGADLPRYMRARLQVYARQQEAEWQRVC